MGLYTGLNYLAQRAVTGIPTRPSIRWQLVIAPLTYVVNVLASGKIRLFYLDDGANRDDLPALVRVREFAQQIQVHPLINYTVEAQARVRDSHLVLCLGDALGTPEVLGVHAGREAMNIRVAVLLSFIQTLPTREYYVSLLSNAVSRSFSSVGAPLNADSSSMLSKINVTGHRSSISGRAMGVYIQIS